MKCMLKCVLFIKIKCQNIKQEYSRYQRWRHLEVVLNQELKLVLRKVSLTPQHSQHLIVLQVSMFSVHNPFKTL